MPRLLKPLKVGEYSGNDAYGRAVYGITVPLYYDRNKHNHFAEFGDELIVDADLGAVKRQLEEKLRQWVEVTWMRVLEVKASVPITATGERVARYAGRVELEFDRYWIGRMTDGKLRKLRWDWHERSRDALDETRTPDAAALRNAESFWWQESLGTFAPPCCRPTGHRNQGDFGASATDTHYLPYDAALWAALLGLGETLIAIRAHLNVLVGTEAGRAHLATVARDGLPALAAEIAVPLPEGEMPS